jgi:hypothetical protein
MRWLVEHDVSGEETRMSLQVQSFSSAVPIKCSNLKFDSDLPKLNRSTEMLDLAGAIIAVSSQTHRFALQALCLKWDSRN